MGEKKNHPTIKICKSFYEAKIKMLFFVDFTRQKGAPRFPIWASTSGMDGRCTNYVKLFPSFAYMVCTWPLFLI